MAENLIAVWLDLECASGNDARSTESEIRVGAKILPFLIAGSDLICSGLGSILKYDNSFNPSLINGEELEDYLVLQRDFEADGGLTPMPEERAHRPARARGRRDRRRVRGARLSARRRADMKASVVFASGLRRDATAMTPRDVALISEAIKARGITVVDVIKALAQRGFREEAENLLNVVKLRVSGDYLQTSAMVRNGRIVSAVNDPERLSRPRHRLSRVAKSGAWSSTASATCSTREEVLRSEAAAREGRGKAHPLPRRWAAAERVDDRATWSSASARPSA